eukprot:5687881-Amphidinium_carterae.1
MNELRLAQHGYPCGRRVGVIESGSLGLPFGPSGYRPRASVSARYVSCCGTALVVKLAGQSTVDWK